jgi:HD-GYP domain-containing protein (c-di-GMP phosphodiesterase class II)
MNEIPLNDLKPQLFFSNYLLLDGSYVLLAPETPVTQELLNRLAKWEFRTVHATGKPLDAAPEAEAPASEAEAAEGAVARAAESGADGEKLEAIVAYYAKFTDYVESVFTRFVTKNQLDQKELMERVKGIYNLVAEDRRLVLRAQSLALPNKNYLVSHAVRSAVLSIILGMTLKLPIFRLIELGTAAILHEIGMIRLPPQIYMAGRQLTPQERKSITAHPVIGYNLLKEQQASLAVCLAALEHHERMNGSGYPRGLSGDKISLYSRIIMVACSYDAVTSSRPYKEARNGYAGMVDILKNEGKQYDETVIRALVYSLSIYPIGTHVLLTNGKSALVVDVNPENPRYPIVQVVGARSPDGKDLVVHTAETGVRVLRPLSKEETEQLPK